MQPARPSSLDRGLGRVGFARFLRRVGTALDGIDLSPLERTGSIPMNAATLGSLAQRFNALAERERNYFRMANSAALENAQYVRILKMLRDQNEKLVAENRELSTRLAEASGVNLAEWATGEGDPRDTGVPDVAVALSLDPLAAAEARLAAAKRRAQIEADPENVPSVPAGTDGCSCGTGRVDPRQHEDDCTYRNGGQHP